MGKEIHAHLQQFPNLYTTVRREGDSRTRKGNVRRELITIKILAVVTHGGTQNIDVFFLPFCNKWGDDLVPILVIEATFDRMTLTMVN